MRHGPGQRKHPLLATRQRRRSLPPPLAEAGKELVGKFERFPHGPLPGKLPEALKGESLELSLGDATSKTTKGRTKVTWEQETAEGMLLVLGYMPKDASHVEGMTLNFPKGMDLVK